MKAKERKKKLTGDKVRELAATHQVRQNVRWRVARTQKEVGLTEWFAACHLFASLHTLLLQVVGEDSKVRAEP